jgi:SAM-dependent methyltransferase
MAWYNILRTLRQHQEGKSMIESQSGTRISPRPHRKISIQERSVRIGDAIVVNAFHANRALLKQRFAEGGYQIHEMPHFLVFTRSTAPTPVFVHWFAPEKINADLGSHIMQELRPAGFVCQADDFGLMIAAIICSLAPTDPQQAFYRYATNTLSQYHHLLDTNMPHPYPQSNMDAFATLYRRVCQLPLGESLLDAGCLFGFLTLLVAERIPTLKRIVGLDIQNENFPILRALVEEKRLRHVQFVQADLLEDEVKRLGSFDTVVALDVLEHFTEAQMDKVLLNLLAVTTQRLVIAVPYESEPEKIYGHQQTFTHAKLEAVGQWCVEQWRGHARYWYEECVGGFLVIERSITAPYEYGR